MPFFEPPKEKKIFTVSELTENIKTLLENNFAFVWITGEISNLRIPASGHCYLTLKDNAAQISAVMFKGQLRNLKFNLEDGMKVTGFGRVTVYSPRGTYQIIFEHLEPSGIGALQAAFEQLKARLFKEGLFDESHKKPIPFLPSTICLITSPTGAVVHDMIHVISRRFDTARIEIIPVKVQGDGAADQIVSAIEMLNARAIADVAILARGGGSLEDLAAFNTEAVARAVFASRIPIISAVGHETDYTICDFVADLRAPTPSAAAELVVPEKSALLQQQATLLKQLEAGMRNQIHRLSASLSAFSRRLIHPTKRLDDLRLRADDDFSRLVRSFSRFVHLRRERLQWRSQGLYSRNPLAAVFEKRKTLQQNKDLLVSTIASYIHLKGLKIRELNSRLQALNPAAVLERGYSIARSIPDHAIITDSHRVSIGQLIEILLAKGQILCRVERKTQNDQKKL